jgi:ABC-type sugar transport system permease subunit
VGLRNYSDILSVHFVSLPDPTVRANEVLPANYGEVFRTNVGFTTLMMGARDPLFWTSLANTVRYVFLLVSLAVLPALLLAMILNSKVPGMKVFRALFFLPSIAAVVGVGLIWLWLYNPVVGFINYAITNVTTFLGTTDPRINWLTDDNVMMFAVVVMAAWQVIGFNTVIFLAGLQGINREVMEAALVDGAGSWVRFTRIMLPLLAPTTFFVLVTTLISGLQAFSEFFVLLGTSTSNARLTTVYYLYLKGFRDIRFGYASSTAWVLFAVIFVVTLIQFRLSSRADAYSD